jgi:hypothetical protein
MNLNTVIAAVSTLVACGVGIGCGSDDGTLQQNWTIQGTTNPNSCVAAQATQMRLVAIGSDGVAEATTFSACNAFQASQSLKEDTYTGAATFLDANGVAVSQTKLVPPFTIVEGQTTVRTIDFAVSDFFPR